MAAWRSPPAGTRTTRVGAPTVVEGSACGSVGTVATAVPLTELVAETVSVPDPDTPAMVAVIVAWPVASAVTTPLDDTVATLELELDHVGGPAETVFFVEASSATAVA
jgi:hypothetical protein